MLLFSATATNSFSLTGGEWEDIQHHHGAHEPPSLSNHLRYFFTSSTKIC